ncbi:acyltransferase family protein [Pseudoalteromonas piscicida]|uniref:Acyltransferase n=1 Tax=Pseudoalteromonas piscicida TaxID=43662 RepID=A0A2A5JV16_PSEO7|nr:acyltransferase family protein [Pseudoalteromonas piscicida]PCK33169.1 acyltransferase [Pseudoalteromonas piscicida]
MQFRKDINGLRAIAVIAVVLFHFNSNWAPGGFAGVDVFFVISGFLMTGIIFKGLDQGNFSITQFYIARANRIIPALGALCFALLVFGWFFLPPIDYAALGKHAASSIGFVSNITYWRESGYFDAASHEKWLLHTWSLSVEWQFYIIYPLVLVAMRKFISLKTMKMVILIGATLGFILCVLATYKFPNPAYYLLPTRAWEMMLGGVAYLYPLNFSESRKKVVEWTGLILIVLSYIFISQDNLWPGYLAILPVFGTFLLIQANRNDSIITGNAVFQSIGKWSYSIYLWHWPIVVAIYYFSLSAYFTYLGLLISILLGFLSSRYIESLRLVRNAKGFFGFLKLKPVLLTIFIGILGVGVFNENGFLSRFDIKDLKSLYVNRVDAESYYRNNLMRAFSNNNEVYNEVDLCTLDGDMQNIKSISDCLNYKLGDGGYLVIGDSHGRDFLHSLFIAYPNLNFSMLHQSSCVPTEYKAKKQGGVHCFKLLNELRDTFILGNEKIKGIILASLYGDGKGLSSMIEDINKNVYGDIPVYVVNAGPRIDKDIVDLAIKSGEVRDSYSLLSGRNVEVLGINNKIAKLRPKAEVFDKYSIFCSDENKCRLNDGVEPYIWDGGHLSALGIHVMSKAIIENELIKTAP